MPFNDRDRAAAKAIVAVFETGRVRGNASAVAVLPDGAGVSYGSHQCTHRAGSLLAVVREAIALGCPDAAALLPYVKPLSNTSPQSVSRLARDGHFHALLRHAGLTPEMRRAQEVVFDRDYLQPALDACEGSGFVEPLSLAVVFDGFIHGGFARIRDRVPPELEERDWIVRYLTARRAWLAGHAKPILRKTVYRQDAFFALIKTDNWALRTPFSVRGVAVREEDLA